MALLAVALVASNAMAASNPPSSVTATASAPLALGSQRSATARCPKNAPQVTGGGCGGTGKKKKKKVQPERHRQPRG